MRPEFQDSKEQAEIHIAIPMFVELKIAHNLKICHEHMS